MAEHTTITPSGFHIVFEDGEEAADGTKKRRKYTVDGDRLVSITTVLGIIDKPGLQWAAEKLTVAAAIELAREGELPLNVQGALSRMGARKLRFRQIWDSKATRGTVTHDDLVRVAAGEEPRDLDSFPRDQRAFIRGVSGWYADYRPVIEQAELMVASPANGYAGRPDLFGTLPTLHPSAKFLIELKTTEKLPRYKSGEVKPPYPEHLIQLGGQEIARRESGYEASDFQAVLRVDAEGEFDLFVTIVKPESFLKVLDCYREVRGLGKPDRAQVTA